MAPAMVELRRNFPMRLSGASSANLLELPRKQLHPERVVQVSNRCVHRTNDRMLSEHTSTHLRIASRMPCCQNFTRTCQIDCLNHRWPVVRLLCVDDDMHAAHMRSILHRLALASGIASGSAMCMNTHRTSVHEAYLLPDHALGLVSHTLEYYTVIDLLYFVTNLHLTSCRLIDLCTLGVNIHPQMWVSQGFSKCGSQRFNVMNVLFH